MMETDDANAKDTETNPPAAAEEPGVNDYKDVTPPGYTMEHLKDCVRGMNTNLKEQCEFVMHTSDIQELCDSFVALLCIDRSMQDLGDIYCAACIVYMMADSPEYLYERTYLVDRVFQEADTINPFHIDYFTQVLLARLKLEDRGYMLNLVQLLTLMSAASETGKAIAVSIAKFIIADITNSKIIVYTFKGFSEIIRMLHSVDMTDLLQTKSLQSVYVLVHAVGFVLNAFAFSQNEVFLKYAYRDLKLTEHESKKLHTWCNNLVHALEDQSNTDIEAQHSDLRMHITRYIMLTIINTLDTGEATFGPPPKNISA